MLLWRRYLKQSTNLFALSPFYARLVMFCWVFSLFQQPPTQLEISEPQYSTGTNSITNPAREHSISALLAPEGSAPEGFMCHQQRLTPSQSRDHLSQLLQSQLSRETELKDIEFS